MKPQDRFDWERAVVRYIDMCSTDKLVAYALGTFANADGTSIRPGSDLLATATGLDRSTVQASLRRLRDRGVIRQVSRGGGSKASLYELAVPHSLLSVALDDTSTEGGEEAKCRPGRRVVSSSHTPRGVSRTTPPPQEPPQDHPTTRTPRSAPLPLESGGAGLKDLGGESDQGSKRYARAKDLHLNGQNLSPNDERNRQLAALEAWMAEHPEATP